MGRFRREFKFSLKTKKHLFFLVLLCLVIASAVWIFRLSLQQEMKTSFPGDYGETAKRTEQTFRIAGTQDEMAAVSDSDLKAELLFNQALHQADWMTYSEAVVEDLYIRSYTGPEQMVVGAEEGKYEKNSSVEMEGQTYAYVKAVWLGQETAAAAGLGMYADELFRHPTDYINTLYVMLGHDYEEQEVYEIGDVLQVKTSYGNVEATVTGFLSEGAAVELNGRTISLDSYVLCPLVDMSDLYGEAPDTDDTYLSPIYIDPQYLGENNAVEGEALTDGENTYTPVKAIWFDRDLRDDASLEASLQEMLKQENTAQMSFVFLGASYRKQGVKLGSSITLIAGCGKRAACCVGFFTEGLTYEVNGENVVLDDYIGIVQYDYSKMYGSEPVVPDGQAPTEPEEPTPSEPAAGDGTGNADGDVIATMRPDISYNLGERSKLFHVLFLKNRGYMRTELTANEAQRELTAAADEAWKNFYLENEGIKAITAYTVAEADSANSILFRNNVKNILKTLQDVDGWIFVAGLALVLAYFLLKRRAAQEYYITLLLTGSSVWELMLLFLVEILLFYLGAVAFGYLASWLICRLLQLQAVSWKELLKVNLLAVSIPGILILLRVAFADYGKLFRRGRR